MRSARVGKQVLFEEQLRAVRERLQEPERPGAVRADPVLHVRDHLALEPDHQQHRHEQSAEGDSTLTMTIRKTAEVDAVGEERIGHQIVSSRTSVASSPLDEQLERICPSARQIGPERRRRCAADGRHRLGLDTSSPFASAPAARSPLEHAEPGELQRGGRRDGRRSAERGERRALVGRACRGRRACGGRPGDRSTSRGGRRRAGLVGTRTARGAGR